MKLWKGSDLNSVGAAFAFPIGDGRFSVCRILLDRSNSPPERAKHHQILIASSAWIGARIPHPGDPALRPILKLTHHSHKNTPNTLWTWQEPPGELIPIGVIETTKKEREIACNQFGEWTALTCQPLMQWRWDNDRNAVLAEDEINERKRMEEWNQAALEREKYLKSVTLSDLQEHLFLRNWSDSPTPKEVVATRNLLRQAVGELIGLGANASESDRMAVLEKCILSFNKLQGELGFIETPERDAILREFEAIICACGLGAYKELADRWREW